MWFMINRHDCCCVSLYTCVHVCDSCLLQVVGLLLGYNRLLGAMSPSLGLLSTLRVLDLSGNSLSGTYPQLLVINSS